MIEKINLYAIPDTPKKIPPHIIDAAVEATQNIMLKSKSKIHFVITIFVLVIGMVLKFLNVLLSRSIKIRVPL